MSNPVRVLESIAAGKCTAVREYVIDYDPAGNTYEEVECVEDPQRTDPERWCGRCRAKEALDIEYDINIDDQSFEALSLLVGVTESFLAVTGPSVIFDHREKWDQTRAAINEAHRVLSEAKDRGRWIRS